MKAYGASRLGKWPVGCVLVGVALFLLSGWTGLPGVQGASLFASLPSAEGGAGYLFVDEFDGTSLDTTAWVALNRSGDASNGEVQCYLSSNAAVANGLLTLTSRVDSSCAGYSYTSAMVQWRSFNFLYGTIEVRAKLAGGTTWPAIWLLGADCQQTNVTTADNVPPCNWPYPGSDEIDIAEVMGGNRTRINQQIHSSLGHPGCSASTSDVSQNWHTYTLVWEPGKLTFQIDGTTTCVLTQAVPSQPMFLMINTALGGHGGPVDPATLPQTSVVDYVRVSQTTAIPTPTPQTCPCGLWNTNTTPNAESASDSESVELGVKFQSDVAGFISGIRFYKGSTNTGRHIGNLWTNTGSLLARETFTNETPSGWQQVTFATPVPIAANTTYVASYFAPAGNYATNAGYFGSTTHAPPLRALADGLDANGVYAYSPTSTFPTQSFNATNYWIDVVFSPAASPAATATLTPTATSTPTPTATPPPALLQNGSFELVAGGFPTSWQARSTAFADSAVAHSGSTSLRVDGPAAGSAATYSFQPSTLLPGATYQLSVWARTQTVTGAGVSVRYVQTSPTTLVWQSARLAGTADWTPLTVTFTAPAATAGGRVDLLWEFNAGDRAWLDDVQLRCTSC